MWLGYMSSSGVTGEVPPKGAQGEYALRFPNCPLLPSLLVTFPPISCPSPNSPAIRASVGVAPVQAALTEDLRLGSL